MAQPIPQDEDTGSLLGQGLTAIGNALPNFGDAPNTTYVPGASDGRFDTTEGGSLTDGDSTYNFESFQFPADLGSGATIHGHSMLININVPNYSLQGTMTGPGSQTDYLNYTVQTGGRSRADTYRERIDAQWKASGQSVGSSGRFGGGQGFINRRTSRINQSILLYMPSTVAFTTQNHYEDVSFTEVVASGAKNIIGGAANMFGPAGRGVAGAVSAGVDAVLGAANLAGKLNNTPVNPRVEVMYTKTPQRTFDYTFLFAPDSDKESKMLERLIRMIRFHAAPEMTNDGFGALNPFFLTPPAEFDITFFHNGKENRAIPRINTCVLERVDVDYAPTGAWSTFENGHPVHLRMVLTFKELFIIDKKKVRQGF